MKAIVYHSYGAADVLKLEDIQQPIPKDDQVLIKVRAAALNPLDWRMMKGVPLPFSIMMRMHTPSIAQPMGIGRDVAGVVEASGKDVTQFKIGDEVFGLCEAAVAEYFDVVLECVGNKPFSECRPVLMPEGRYVIVGGPHDVTMASIMASALKTIAQSLFSRQKAVMFIAKSSQPDLTFLGELIATG